ncbi:MAG TPA: type I-B CRISPR-associated protein Cas7/Cst2/DevR [Terriglobia bacterium]|nr:type I-B CRISPR-associated protein Cas7/Cst2/DevR [Terriglobia bacterium]
MAYIAGLMIIDAPASALNNAGSEEGARTDNTIGVKKIDRQTPYVSAQAFRHWLRIAAAEQPGWVAARVGRESKIAYTDADPIKNWDDDLFGYMRAPSKRADVEQAKDMSPLEKDREITRVSPLRVSTLVAVGPSVIVDDFGTMTRQDGDPVPHEHQFYRAHLQGLLSLDLTSAGTFYDMERTGFKNMDSNRRDAAKAAGCEEGTIRGQKAWRLPSAVRRERVATLLDALATVGGGAKMALHYTDITPAVMMLAVVKHGNNPFYRTFVADSGKLQTQFHRPAFDELMAVHGESFLSDIHIGWAQGFLGEQRQKMSEAVEANPLRPRIKTGHPVEIIRQLAGAIRGGDSSRWFD